MTTLTRERRKKFEEILSAFSDKLTRAEIEATAELLAEAAQSRTETIVEKADQKVDVIIAFTKQSQAAEEAGHAWRGREFLVGSEYLKYGDWWYKKTGLEMYGAKAKAKLDGTSLIEFKSWWENDITLETLDLTYQIENDWRKGKSGLEQNITHPRELTAKAKAIQAAGAVKPTTTPAKVYQPEPEPEYVPAPPRKR